MKVYALFLLLVLGFIILAYYLYLVIIGKSLARHVGSKDRFIWNGLKNITDKASRGRVTIFLDDNHIFISTKGLASTYSSMRRGELDQGYTIPYEDIRVFDYDAKKLIPFISPLINHLFKVNDYILRISYFDQDGQVRDMKFKASSMDPIDFELSFAEFNNKIYGSGGLRRSAGNLDYEDEIPQDKKANQDNSTLILGRASSQKLEKRAEEPSGEMTQQFGKGELEELRRDLPSSPAKDLPKKEAAPSKTDKVPPHKNQRDEEKTSFFSKKIFSDKKPQDNQVEPSVKEEDYTVTRRSFLDRDKKREVEKEEKTLQVELPEELKKFDTKGLSEEEISQKELERLNKLKEFFSEKIDD